jgi:uncharacterized protein (TIGR00661 family)
MKILYGVCGEGLGHAMRSAVVARHLAGLGHSVQFCCSPGRALDYLAERFPEPGRVVGVAGFSLAVHKNALSPVLTIAQNFLRQVAAIPVGHLLAARKITVPDVVISDFEPLSARYAHALGRPLIAVDNIHFMNRFAHNKDLVPAADRGAAALMHPVVSMAVPGAREYLVTSIAGAVPYKPDTTLYQPILRPEILECEERATDGDHILVYFNNQHDHRATCAELFDIPETFRVYGALPPTAEPRTTRNVTLCPFSEEAFISDLAGCKAAISGAGFTTISEAVFLKKPLLAVPFAGQFEQILNSNYLRALSYGERAASVTGAVVSAFLGSLPKYKAALSHYRHDHNAALLGAVERAIAA